MQPDDDEDDDDDDDDNGDDDQVPAGGGVQLLDLQGGRQQGPAHQGLLPQGGHSWPASAQGGRAQAWLCLGHQGQQLHLHQV